MSLVLGQKVLQSPPGLATDMLKATLDELCAQIAQTSDCTLAFVINLKIEPLNVQGTLALMLTAQAVKKLLTKLNY